MTQEQPYGMVSCCPPWPKSATCPTCGKQAPLSKELYDWPSKKKWQCPNGHKGSAFGYGDGTLEIYPE